MRDIWDCARGRIINDDLLAARASSGDASASLEKGLGFAP